MQPRRNRRSTLHSLHRSDFSGHGQPTAARRRSAMHRLAEHDSPTS
jgi:hypothetical protein